MAEYIEREKVLDVLENLGITKNMRVHRNIQGIPAADVVEVVRCKDCAFWDSDGRCDPPRNGLIVEYTHPYDFCSYGKRKDGAEDDR